MLTANVVLFIMLFLLMCRPTIAYNVPGLSEVGPKVQFILVFTSTNIIKIVYEDVRPHFSKPVLCTVDVPWFVRMEGQRSFRPHTFSKHSQRQKASRSLQFTHSIFTGIYCAYKALSSARQCQGLVTQITPLQNYPTLHKISLLGIGHLQMSKISYTFAKSFLRCQS